MKPHLSYFKRLNGMLDRINGLAHITGGGFYENISRILPTNCRAAINKSSWRVPPIFEIIQKAGNISEREMYNVFNMGIGLVAVVDQRLVKYFTSKGGLEIGCIEKGSREVLVR